MLPPLLICSNITLRLSGDDRTEKIQEFSTVHAEGNAMRSPDLSNTFLDLQEVTSSQFFLKLGKIVCTGLNMRGRSAEK